MTERMTAAELHSLQAPAKSKRDRPERDLHRTIVQWLARCAPEVLFHHSANEIDMSGPGAARCIAVAKSLGMQPGFPDLCLYAGGRGYCAEIKAQGGVLADSQKRVREELRKRGIPYVVWRSLDDVRASLDVWGIPYREVGQ